MALPDAGEHRRRQRSHDARAAQDAHRRTDRARHTEAAMQHPADGRVGPE